MVQETMIDERTERNWVVFCHLGGLIPFYFLNIIIPLIIWHTQKHQSSFIDKQGREIANFQISLAVYGVCFLALSITLIGIPIAVLGSVFLMILNIISIIRGALRASRGEEFLYPLNLRLLK